jgi:hypothetical protein
VNAMLCFASFASSFNSQSFNSHNHSIANNASLPACLPASRQFSNCAHAILWACHRPPLISHAFPLSFLPRSKIQVLLHHASPQFHQGTKTNVCPPARAGRPSSSAACASSSCRVLVRMLSRMLCCLSFFLGGDPRLVLERDTDRSMGVRFSGDLGPRGAPGVGGSSPGIAAMLAERRAARKLTKTD